MTVQTNALAVRQTEALAPMSWSDMLSQAQVLCKSGLIPAKTPEAAVATMLKGREVGFGAMESFELISVIQGRPTVSPKGQLVQIYRSGCLERISITDDGETCTVTMTRKGGATHTATFSMADAKAAGLLGNDNWRKYPKQMRQWRAVGYCADVLFPDVIGGMYRPEEFGAVVDADGCVTIHEIHTGEVVPTPRVEQPKPISNGNGKPRLSRDEMNEVAAALDVLGQTTPEAKKEFVSGMFGANVTSAAVLTREQADKILSLARETQDAPAAPVVVDATIVDEQDLGF